MTMHVGGGASPQEEDQVVDTRGPSLGLGRLVMAAFWIFGAWVTTNAVMSTSPAATGIHTSARAKPPSWLTFERP